MSVRLNHKKTQMPCLTEWYFRSLVSGKPPCRHQSASRGSNWRTLAENGLQEPALQKGIVKHSWRPAMASRWHETDKQASNSENPSPTHSQHKQIPKHADVLRPLESDNMFIFSQNGKEILPLTNKSCAERRWSLWLARSRRSQLCFGARLSQGSWSNSRLHETRKSLN